MEQHKLIIEPKTRTEYVRLSIALPKGMSDRIGALAKASNRSRTEIIKLLLEYALKHCEIS